MRKRRERQLGAFWLSRRTGRSNWYIMWFDPNARQTRRQATGADDFAEAERLLAERFTLAETLEEDHPADVTLTTVLDRHWHEHASKLPSKGSRQTSCTAVKLLRQLVGSATVADFGRKEQERIVRLLRERGLSDGYIRRIFDTARAALRRAYANEEIAGVPACQMCRRTRSSTTMATEFAKRGVPWNEIVLGHAIPSTTLKIDDRGSAPARRRFACHLRANWPARRRPNGG